MKQQLSNQDSGSRRLVVVLGMHRSGTSAITKSLELLGVGLGSDLHPAGADNPKGFWEDRECIEINDRLLKHLGSAYDRLDLAWEEIKTDAKVSELQLKASQLINRKLLENNGLWGFKDPRTCRLLGFWDEVFQAVNCEVSLVIAVRNPASVVASLATRNHIPVEKAYFLWLQHVLPPLNFMQDARRVIVDYDELLSNPYAQVARISARLGLPLPDRQNPSVQNFENNYLENGLRHTRFTEAEIALDSRASTMVAETYGLLHRLATDKESLESATVKDALAEFNSRLKSISPAFDYINFLEDERKSIRQDAANLKQAVARSDEKIAQLNKTVSDMLNSSSWRLTRPVRFAGVQYARLKNKFKSVNATAIRQCASVKSIFSRANRVCQDEGIRGILRVLLNLPAYLSPQAVGNKPILAQTGTNQSDNEFVAYQKNPPINPLVKLIAFYLPQFHPFPENDLWWGKGFTEWTNVGKAQPNYVGHYQPHCPIHLGYYDLRVPQVMEEQAKLAKEYGIYGFSYYFYWFGGKVLMDLPLEAMLNNKKVDMPFCLTWANENWSRRWDGRDNDILIAQKHSDEDSLAFIRHLVKYFKDERYIRIDGKPVLIIYRADIIPNIIATAKIWREEVLKHGFPGLYLVSAQAFFIESPEEFHFDASVEFPPHGHRTPPVQNELTITNKKFNGLIYSYERVVAKALSSLESEPDYKVYRTAMLTWDNTARKQNNSHIFHGFSLPLYKQWLSAIINKSLTNQKYSADEKIVFVNAWNEWAEGTHLEPDQKFGYGYLQTTYDALQQSIDQSRKIIVVSHDAHPHGAQFLAMNMAKVLGQEFGFQVEIVCLGNGPLVEMYSQYGQLHNLAGLDHRGADAHELVKKLVAAGHHFAIVNTTVSGFFLETLKAHGIRCVSLIHELSGVLDQYKLHEQAKTIAKLADKVVFAARQVADHFQQVAPVKDGRRVLRPQGLYKKNAMVGERDFARKELRKMLQLPTDALIVLGVGYADHRKGIDLFVDAGKKLVSSMPKVYWVWVGLWHHEMQVSIDANLAQDTQKKSHFIFPGRRDDTDLFYAGADVYALTSREDPFPSVVLEAMDASLPVVGFEGIGGCSELLELGSGKLVPAFDTASFASALKEILVDQDLAKQMGKVGKTQIRERFSFRNYLFDLLKLIEYPLPRISVVVPNYNYARYLMERIKSIEKQTLPVYELIIIDDCSSDDSVQIIEKIIQNSPLDIKFVCNTTNSGSVFAQWQKGVELATGDLVWIAEADDLSEPDFLINVVQGFNHADVVLSYCESQQIDQDGKMLRENYLGYVAAIGRERWLKPYVRTGREEIVDALSIKNTIPNVSAVVFRRNILSEVLKREQDHIREFTVAGDWYIYTKVLERGGIAFTPHAANIHRRHAKSVTNASRNLSQLAEIVRMQHLVASAHPVSEDAQKTAWQYTQKVYEKLGLASGEFQNFEQALASREKVQ